MLKLSQIVQKAAHINYKDFILTLLFLLNNKVND
jgi:hypothetical protein